MYIFYNPNPNGQYTMDCTIRAVCKALNQTWDETYLDICMEGFLLKTMPSSSMVWNSYLKKKGFNRFTIPNTCPECYTVSQFAKDYNKGTYIVATDDHVVAVVNGDYYDTGDSGNEVPVYYWKEIKVDEQL